MRTFLSDFGPIGGLICGENSNPLAIYLLGAQNMRAGSYVDDIDAKVVKYGMAQKPFSRVWAGFQHLDSLNADPNFDLELKPGMKLSDLIASFEALLPEPYLEHAEIIRLLPPDRKPTIISFNLGELLKGDAQYNLSLQNQDRVIIFPKASLKEVPQVGISGEVQNPGSGSYWPG
jgi:hypothetical protein